MLEHSKPKKAFRLGTKLGFSIAPRFKVVNLLGFRVRSLSKVYH